MTTETTETVKTLFRPLLTLILVITWLVFIASGTDYPRELMWLVLAFSGEWLSERSLKRFLEMKRKQT